MLDVVSYWKDLGLPTRHLMYDSWWYWKECPAGANNTWLKCKGAVELWEPRPDVFHDGFNFKAPFPLALHNRWFSGNNNTYIKDLGFADSFIVEEAVDFALPIKADVFTYLMGFVGTAPRAPSPNPLSPARQAPGPSSHLSQPPGASILLSRHFVSLPAALLPHRFGLHCPPPHTQPRPTHSRARAARLAHYCLQLHERHQEQRHRRQRLAQGHGRRR